MEQLGVGEIDQMVVRDGTLRVRLLLLIAMRPLLSNWRPDPNLTLSFPPLVTSNPFSNRSVSWLTASKGYAT